MEMVTVNLLREGVNKHKARELAEHFYGLAPAQPAPVPLTDEQIEHLWETRVSQPCPSYPLEKSDWVQFARAIEAKLKEKNNGY
jgi:hypothetical protein